MHNRCDARSSSSRRKHLEPDSRVVGQFCKSHSSGGTNAEMVPWWTLRSIVIKLWS